MAIDYRATLPAKRMGTAALFVDPAGRALIVQPSYKPYWELPGGVVEAGESPMTAALERTERNSAWNVARGGCSRWTGCRLGPAPLLGSQTGPRRDGPRDRDCRLPRERHSTWVTPVAARCAQPWPMTGQLEHLFV